MKNLGIIGAICLGMSGSVNAGTLDKIKTSAVDLLGAKSEKENGGMKSMMKFDQSKLYFTLGENTYRAEGGFDQDSKNDNYRIGYDIDNDWAIELEWSKAKAGYVFKNNIPSTHWYSDQGLYVKYEPYTVKKISPFFRAGIIKTKVNNTQPGFDVSWTEGEGDNAVDYTDSICGGFGSACNWNESDVDLSLGIGANWEITENFGLRGDISYINYSIGGGDSNNKGENKHIKSGLSVVYGF